VEVIGLKLKIVYSVTKCKKFPQIEKILSWYPVIKREFPEDEKDFGEWCYND